MRRNTINSHRFYRFNGFNSFTHVSPSSFVAFRTVNEFHYISEFPLARPLSGELKGKQGKPELFYFSVASVAFSKIGRH